MIDKNIFLPKGKLNRKYFFAFMVIVWIFMIIYFLLISYIYNINNFNELNLLYEQNRNLFNIPKVIYLYIVVCMISKRFRDLNWNVWISLLALLPGFDVLLSIICLLFKSKNKEKKSIKNQNIKSIDKPTKKISTIKLYTIIIFILVILIIILTAIIYRQEIRIKKIISPQEQSEYDYQSDFYMSGKNDSNKYNKLYENFACKENFICFIDEYGNNIFQINKKKYDYFGNFIEDRMFVANKIKTVDAIGLSIPTIVNISLLDSTGKVIKDFFNPVLIETDPEYTSANLILIELNM